MTHGFVRLLIDSSQAVALTSDYASDHSSKAATSRNPVRARGLVAITEVLDVVV